MPAERFVNKAEALLRLSVIEKDLGAIEELAHQQAERIEHFREALDQSWKGADRG